MQVNKKAVYFLAAFLVMVFIGGFPDFCGIVFFTALALAVLACLNKFGDKSDARFLTVLIAVIFIARVVLAIGISYLKGGILSQDEGLYSKKALDLVYESKGYRNSHLLFYEYYNDLDLRDDTYGFNAYPALLSKYYKYFGYRTLDARLLTVVISILCIVLVFFTIKEMFGPKPARVGAILFAVFPSLNMWSVMVALDYFVIFCTLLFFWLLVRFVKTSNVLYVLPMPVMFYLTERIRPHVFIALALMLVVAAVIKIFKRMTNFGRLTVIVLAVLFVLPLLPSAGKVAGEKIKKKMEFIMELQITFARIDDSGYLIFPEKCYVKKTCTVKEFIPAYAKGMAFMLFSPFPWDIRSKLQMMAYPQIMFFYLMVPLIIYGFYSGFRENKLLTAVFFIYVFFLCSVLSVASGNIGAVFRHRDMVTPVFIIFFAKGLTEAFKYFEKSNKAVI